MSIHIAREKSCSKSELDDVSIIERSTVNSNTSSSEPKRPARNELTQRRLKPRHIQLIGIGGTIGTTLFVQMGGVLLKGGPGSLFVAYAFWTLPVLCLTSCTAEMVTQFPLPSPFVRLAGRVVDQGLEVAAGYAFFILEATLVPFEITAVTLIIHYWRDDFTPAAVIIPQLAVYVLINLLVPVSWFGEVEFWMAIFKVFLILGLIIFTFLTMVGVNPMGWAYGFTNWNRPAPFLEYIAEGPTGRFLGFTACLALASYTIVGPDYVSMTAGEAINPRRNLPSAFKGVVIRLTVFYILGSLAMGVVCPPDDPVLREAWAEGGRADATASPYVAGMLRLNIPILPHVVNVGILLSAFSAGNSYFYAASRTLYGLALEGHAPRVFRLCTKNGVPYMSALVVCGFAMLSFLQLSNSATTVLNYIVGVGTSCELIIYSIISFTYIRFYKACVAQNVDRRQFAYRGWWQPYQAYFCFACMFTMLFGFGHGVFLKGNWNVGTFITNYIMIPVSALIFLFYKFVRKSKFHSPMEVDLVSGLEEVEEHEKTVVYIPPRNKLEAVWRTIIGDS